MHNYSLFDIDLASKWLASYVIGNGRMGDSLFYGVSQDIIYLNDEITLICK